MNLSCEQVAAAVLGPPLRQSGAELFFRCPNHADRHPSLQVNQRKNAFLCGPCGKGGNAWRFAAFLGQVDPQDTKGVASWLRERGLLEASNGHHAASNGASSSEPKGEFQRVAEFYYSPELRKVRLERPSSNGSKPEKTFRWEHREGDRWRAGDGGLPKPLYVNRIFAADPNSPAIGVEGEAKADALADLGFAAFNFKQQLSENVVELPQHCQRLAGRMVIFWPDADAPGFKQANEAARVVHASGLPASVWTITPPPEMPIAGDVIDAVRTLGWGKDEIAGLIGTATKYPPEPPPVGLMLDSVTEQKVSWLWRGRIPLGALTILDGDPGCGKSLLSIEIASRISKGAPLPGDTDRRPPAGTVLCTAEDSLPHVSVPRLRAAAADLSRVVAIPYSPSTPGEKTFSRLPADLLTLERAIQRVGAKLVILDVLSAYIPVTLSMQRDQDVRNALAPLAAMADRLQVACLLLRHLNKDTSKSTLYRGGGSIGIIGAARSGLLLAPDPNDAETRVLALIKSNFGAPADSLSFRIHASDGVPNVDWTGTSQQSAEQLLAPQTSDEHAAVREAAEFLREELRAGPIAAKEIFKKAEELGISRASLKRAKSSVATSYKEGLSSWYWGLKADVAK